MARITDIIFFQLILISISSCNVLDHFKHVTFEGNNKGEKRGDVKDDPYVKNLAEESLEKFCDRHINDCKLKDIHKVITKLEFSKIIVSIKFTASGELAYIPSGRLVSLACSSDIHLGPGDWKKEIYVECIERRPEERDTIIRPSEEVVQNPEDTKYKKMAKEALDQYRNQHPDFKPLKLAEVVSVITTSVNQIVVVKIKFIASGWHFGHVLAICDAHIYEIETDNPNETETDISQVNCAELKHNKEDAVLGEFKHNKGGAVLGELHNKQDAKLGEFKHNKEDAVLDFKHTKEDAALGEFKRNKEDAALGEFKRSKEDAVLGEFKHNKEVAVLREFKHNKEDAVLRELKHNKKDALLGGIFVENPNDPIYKKLAKEALNKYSEGHFGFTYKVTAIQKVTTQVVDGFITRINFRALCQPGYQINKLPSTLLACYAEILERPWENLKEIKVNCVDLTKITRRDS